MDPGNKTFNGTLIFVAASLAMLVFGIVLISLGSVLPHLRDIFGLSDLSTGSLLSLLPLGLLIGSLVFGPLVDRYGYKILLLACGLLVFAGLEGIALTKNIMVLRISIFLIGFGGGAINGGANALVADTTEGDRGARLSLLGVFFGIGALGVPFLLGILTPALSNERFLFWTGIFVLLPTIFYLLIKFPPPKHPQGFPIKEAGRLLKDPWILLAGLVLLLQSGLEGLTNNWSTTFMHEIREYPTQAALFSLTFYVASMTVMRMILAWALQHIRSGLILVGGIALSLAGTLLIQLTDSLSITNAGMSLLGAGFAACFPVVMGYVAGKYTQLSGTALSMVLVLALLGNMSSNYGMGLLANERGIGVLPLVIALGLILQLFVLFPVMKKRTEHQHKNNP